MSEMKQTPFFCQIVEAIALHQPLVSLRTKEKSETLIFQQENGDITIAHSGDVNAVEKPSSIGETDSLAYVIVGGHILPAKMLKSHKQPSIP